ncbi:MAG: 23S rRNA (uracil(1939)-C(5))-methyltransferase RlmD [Pseudomonadales bacterium]|nr:23S rRNA (uracil(1939)-C(5))-methyltransferase RlmD [Pseudomonadales bacterium]
MSDHQSDSRAENSATSRRTARHAEPVILDVVTLEPEGYGLTEDRKSAVLGALPGETVRAEFWSRKRKKRFYRATDIIEASSDRTLPVCSAAAHCGGCSLQHMTPSSQIEYKLQQLKLTFGDNQPQEYLLPLTGPVTGYRRKARLGVKFVEKKDKVLVGFREKMKPYVAEIEHCKVLHPAVGEKISELAEMISSLEAVRSIPQIEIAAGDTETALVIRHLEPLSDADLTRLQDFGREQKFTLYLQPGGHDSVHKFFPADSLERLSYRLEEHDINFQFHPLDFTQVNQEINNRMIQLALSLLEISEKDQVFDGFCGIGNFSLPLARRCNAVVAAELSETSVERARENAAANSIANVQFFARDLFEADMPLPELQGCNKVLLDPPRSGALEVCKILAKNKVERVVYVSCNPVTLARDAQLLTASGYRFEYAGVIDMFPHTTHVESVASFSRHA